MTNGTEQEMDWYRRVESLYQRVLDVPAERRRAFLSDESDGEVALLHEVEMLLEHFEAARHSFLNTPAHGLASYGPEEGPLPDRIGAYKVLSVLGAGGMGVVYRAVQEHPQREVALKVIRAGIAGRNLLRRFEFEATVLGRLKHPGIAQIYEAGTYDSETGKRPFFAMELVEGPPLNRYVAGHTLNTRARLDLFLKVCDAVNHAHQKGVIHRDLKPSNILVSGAVPKILDFGVARATDSDLQTTTMQTDVHQIVGTLSYMSPEQVEGQGHLLDVRSDVYALGVVLYELLAGHVPFKLDGKTVAAAARVICDDEPPPLGTIDAAYRGDLNTIALKALEKDPERRYPSVSDFAADVWRYLNDEPITARPATTLYQLRKFARRNKGLVVGLTAALLALTGGLVGTSLALIEAARQRDEAIAASRIADLARDAEVRQRAAAEASETEAQREATRANTVARLLEQMLSSADPSRVQGREYTVRQLLDDFSSHLPERLHEQPLVEADVRTTIGRAYRGLAEFDRADAHLAAALELRRDQLGEAHPKVAGSLTDLARLAFDRGRFDQADSLVREALAIQEAALTMPDGDVAVSRELLARILQQKGDFAAAEDLLVRALATRRELYGEQHPDVAANLHELAVLKEHRGRYGEAESLYRQSFDIQRALGDEQSASFANCLFGLGSSLHAQGKYDEVGSLYQQALALNRKLFGDEHPAVAGSLLGLATFLRARGDLDAGERANREALEIYRRIHGDEHSNVALTMNNLANVLKEKGETAQAEKLHRDALAIRRKLDGDEHPAVANSLTSLAALLKVMGAHEESERCYREALAISEKVYSAEHPRVGFLYLGLADLYFVQEQCVKAEGEFRHSLRLLEAALPDGHPGIMDANIRLGECLSRLGRHEEAESRLLAGYEGMAAAVGQDSTGARRAVAALVELYEGTGDAGRAGEWRSKLNGHPGTAPGNPRDSDEN